mmetsp:Transcript_1980/g.7869  ORF Transcript_1980/g.7869 Transcript_1980/m.7869 type:complete len:276 (-) Transcript_1980:1222-2049(-)
MRIAWPVLDQEERSVSRKRSAGNVARPIATAPSPKRVTGLCASSRCLASSALTPHTAATRVNTLSLPGPLGSIPQSTSAASSYAAKRSFGGRFLLVETPARSKESSLLRRRSNRRAHRSRSRSVNGRPANARVPETVEGEESDGAVAGDVSVVLSILSIPPDVGSTKSKSRSFPFAPPPGARCAAPPWPHALCATLSVASILRASGASRGCTPTSTAAGSSPLGGSTATRAQSPARGSALLAAATPPPARPKPVVTVPKSWNPSAATTFSPRPGT